MRNESAFEQDFEDEDLDSDLGDDDEPDGDLGDESQNEDDDSESDDELSGLEGEELNMVEEGASGELLTSEQA
ncbi:MAG: hypothetical protein F4035_10110, partial [Acidimicrobiia bacterium]|nr:hypothetical protein [Acidimicrobiia bacterium]